MPSNYQETGLDVKNQKKMFEEAMAKKRAQALNTRPIREIKKIKTESESDDDDGISDIINPNAHISQLSSSFSGSSDDDDISHNEEKGEVRNEVNIDTVNKCRIPRYFLKEHLFNPRLRDMTSGFFVRVCLGMNPDTKKNSYKLCLIEDVVKYNKVYRLENLENQNALRVSFAGELKDIPCDMISNSRVEPMEFLRWKEAMKEKKLSIMSELDADNLWRKFAQLRDKPLTDLEIKIRMNARFKFLYNIPNLSKFIIQADDDMKIAEKAGNKKKADKLRRKIAEARELQEKRAKANISEGERMYNMVEDMKKRRYIESIMNHTCEFSGSMNRKQTYEVYWDVSDGRSKPEEVKIDPEEEARKLKEKEAEREKALIKKYSHADPGELNKFELIIDKSLLIENPDKLNTLPIIKPKEGTKIIKFSDIKNNNLKLP